MNESKFGEEHENLFLEMQKDRQNNELSQSSPNTKSDSNSLQQKSHKLALLSPNDMNFLNNSASSEENRDSLKKSLHTGNNGFIFSKTKKQNSDHGQIKLCSFSPIARVEPDEVRTEVEAISKEPESSRFNNQSLTPRSYKLVNPVPIRLSTSASLDLSISKQQFNLNEETNSSRSLVSSQDGEPFARSSSGNSDLLNLAPSRIKMSNSKIWKSASSSSSGRREIETLAERRSSARSLIEQSDKKTKNKSVEIIFFNYIISLFEKEKMYSQKANCQLKYHLKLQNSDLNYKNKCQKNVIVLVNPRK